VEGLSLKGRFFSYHIYFIFVSDQCGLKPIAMKRAIIILVVVFAAGLLLASCNKHVCPAYSQVDTEQAEPAG
jgi:hypothetical protein